MNCFSSLQQNIRLAGKERMSFVPGFRGFSPPGQAGSLQKSRGVPMVAGAKASPVTCFLQVNSTSCLLSAASIATILGLYQVADPFN